MHNKNIHLLISLSRLPFHNIADLIPYHYSSEVSSPSCQLQRGGRRHLAHKFGDLLENIRLIPSKKLVTGEVCPEYANVDIYPGRN